MRRALLAVLGASAIAAGATIQPMRRAARPYTFEKVRVITTFSDSATSSRPAA